MPRSRIAILIISSLALALLLLPALADSLHRLRGSEVWRDDLAIMDAREVGRMMAEGRKVVFVDVREPQEFTDFHVPGALSLPLRDVDDFDASIHADADLVIPYCLKDFRGYEGAKKLKAQGLENVALIEGFGINAWMRADLPIAGNQPAHSDAEALQQLVDQLDMESQRDRAP